MMRSIAGAAGAALFTLGGCSPTAAELADRRVLAEARPIGAPVDCISLAGIRSSRVLDDATIDFEMRDGRVFRNRLRSSCPQLGFEERFSYSTSLAQLCSLEIVTVLTSSGPGASCGLGSFQEIETGRR